MIERHTSRFEAAELRQNGANSNILYCGWVQLRKSFACGPQDLDRWLVLRSNREVVSERRYLTVASISFPCALRRPPLKARVTGVRSAERNTTSLGYFWRMFLRPFCKCAMAMEIKAVQIYYYLVVRTSS